MPQKTKKQKLKRDQHRHSNKTAAAEISSRQDTQEEQKLPTFSFNRSHPSSATVINPKQNIESFVHLRTDLLKTVILAVICCGILIGLSFVLK